MTVRVVPGFDAIAANISHLPSHGVSCGYTTGSDGTNGTVDIRWSEAEFAAHPGAVRICQDSGATDTTADFLDIERGAATIADSGPWVRKARTNFHAVTRPGQREPALYSSANNIKSVTDHLRSVGITGVGLVVANWNLDDAQATKDVEDASGDFPVVGMQWRSGTFYDTDVFSVPWLTNVSHIAPVVAGPYRHVTNGTESIDMISARRNEAAISLLSFTADHYTVADITDMSSIMLPSGVPYYTRNP